MPSTRVGTATVVKPGDKWRARFLCPMTNRTSVALARPISKS